MATAAVASLLAFHTWYCQNFTSQFTAYKLERVYYSQGVFSNTNLGVWEAAEKGIADQGEKIIDCTWSEAYQLDSNRPDDMEGRGGKGRGMVLKS